MVQSKGGFILRRSQNEDESSTSKPNVAGAIGMRQLFDKESSTCTYLLWDKETEDAILIDPVDTQVNRDLLVAANNLNLVFAVNTHCHADHISGTRLLKRKIEGLQSVISKASHAKADQNIAHGDEIHFGNRFVTAIATPGHTEGCMSFLLDDGKAVLTGDALLVRGCGRTDFQGGSAETLYDSIHKHLFTLPDDTIVFPGHDYSNDDDESNNDSSSNTSTTTIGFEKQHNPRLGGGKTKEEFVDIMENLNLPYPQKMDIAVPANLQDGAKPFFVHSLRTRIKQRWGIFG